jgi:CO/xanthine dehydrogenase FAD-binding subunit
MRSFLADYEFLVANDIDIALELLSRGEGWRPIAGGTDLMVLFNAGKLPYKKLVSIRHLAPLRAISEAGTSVEVGAAVTYAQIRQSPIIQADFPLLCQAASWTGSIANQNRGTLGGNIANASPAADSLPVLLVYDAELILLSKRGERRVRYSDFHTAYKQMQIAPDELIVKIRLPKHGRPSHSYGRKVGTRRAQAIAKVCVAARAERKDGVVADIRIALASVAPIPLRCVETESLIRGKKITHELIASARHVLGREITPISDVRSTRDYRALVAGNLLEDFLSELR